MKVQRRVLSKKILVGLMVVYIIFLLWIVFIRVGNNDRNSYYKTAQPNLLPFRTTYKSLKLGFQNHYGPGNSTSYYYLYLAIRNIIGNILLFVPWGVGAPFLIARLRTLNWLFLSIFSFSFSVEMLQLFLKIGVFDVDDIAYNTLGAILGYYVYTRVSRLHTTPHDKARFFF